MCGRINVSDNEGVRILLAMLGMEVWPSREPRFNVAPSQSLDVIQWQDNAPTHQSMQWGMLPAWAKPDKFSKPLINARAETIREKPSFRHLIPNHRALIPINGFYEWKREGKSKTPYLVTPTDASAMFVGAIFQPPKNPEKDLADASTNTDKQQIKKALPQVCVVTVESNKEMYEVHHRMPVILNSTDALKWIQASDQEIIDQLMATASNDTVQLSEVSDYVNSARNEGPECVAPKRMGDLFG